MTRSALDPSLYFIASMALIASIMAYRAVVAPHRYQRFSQDDALELFGSVTGAVFISIWLGGRLIDMLPVVAAFLLTAPALRYFSKQLSMPGVLRVTAEFLGLWLGILWSGLFILEAGFPPLIQTLLLAGLAFAISFMLCGFAERLARNAILTHEFWRQPTSAPQKLPTDRERRVSIHLPCYAEPPEVVKETMDRLAAQDYENFEVLVCDNNTKDEALWRPLERHCQYLNRQAGTERFRFFHVAPLDGAKAGALNFCIEQMDPETEIVAVVDADYLAEADFLSRLVPFFEDRRIGYVQTPHDYRDYEGSAYLTGCHWEYMPNNKIDMPGVSEYGGAFTIGTMCLLRASALRKVGGWAEWCLTEDSEVSVRLRAAGYTGIYLGETFGRGLIPETFDDYKKQRFRWTAGPVQQLCRHWRLFLPAPFAAPLPGWTKLLEVLRCVAPIRVLFGLIAGLCGLVATIVALNTGAMEPVDIPNTAWGLLLLGTGTWLISTTHRYKLSGCTSITDMIRGEVARYSLTYTVLQAGIAGLSGKPLAWRRTPKFALKTANDSILATSYYETVRGFVLLLFAMAALLGSDRLGFEFALLIAGSLGTLAFRFLCATYMSALAIDHARRQLGSDQDDPHEAAALAIGEEAAKTRLSTVSS